MPRDGTKASKDGKSTTTVSGGLVGRILQAVAVTVIVGILSYLWDILTPPPDVSGRWYCLTHTTTAGNYKDVLLIYETALTQRPDGELAGEDQKATEVQRGGTTINYRRGQRSTGAITGTLRHPHFASSLVNLSIEETTVSGLRSNRDYSMRVVGERMVGDFTSTVADQEGSVLCQREIFRTSSSDAWNTLHAMVQGSR